MQNASIRKLSEIFLTYIIVTLTHSYSWGEYNLTVFIFRDYINCSWCAVRFSCKCCTSSPVFIDAPILTDPQLSWHWTLGLNIYIHLWCKLVCPWWPPGLHSVCLCLSPSLFFAASWSVYQVTSSSLLLLFIFSICFLPHLLCVTLKCASLLLFLAYPHCSCSWIYY